MNRPAHTFERCIWCERAYPPAVGSREHVLPEFLGVDITLPEGAVCRDCNNGLNTALDQPLKVILQPVITSFGVRSTKRESSAVARVLVATDRGEIAATMEPGGKLRFPARMRRQSVRDGRQVREVWLVRPEEVGPLLAERRKGLEIVDVDVAPVALGSVVAPVRGKAGTLIRWTVRIGINLLAWRSPFLLPLAQAAEARKYVLDEGGTLPERIAEASLPLVRGRFDVSECRPEHTLLVTAISHGPAWFEVRLFGDIFCRVRIAESWDGPPISLEERFFIQPSEGFGSP